MIKVSIENTGFCAVGAIFTGVPQVGTTRKYGSLDGYFYTYVEELVAVTQKSDGYP